MIRRVANKKPENKRIAVLVVGMHRSGTSSLTRVLAEHGFTLPRTLLRANDANPEGYWESPLINRLNDKVLESAGATWQSWYPVRAGWHQGPVFKALIKEAEIMLADEFGNSDNILIKDPRLCRVLPFWKVLLKRLNANTTIISPIRNPLEISASLEKRNGIPKEIGLFLWLRYLLDAERQSRDTPRSFVSYDALLTDWQSVLTKITRTTGLSCSPRTAESSDLVNGFLKPDLRHHTMSDGAALHDRSQPEWVRMAYDIFRRWSRSTELIEDRASLDTLFNLMGTLPASLNGIFYIGEKSIIEARKLRKQIEMQSRQLIELNAILATREAEKSVYKSEVAEVRSTFNAIEERFSASVASATTRLFQIEQLTDSLDSERTRVTQLLASLTARESALNAADRDLAVANAQLSELGARKEMLEQQLKDQAAQSRAGMAQLTDALESERTRSAQLSTSLTAQKRAFIILERKIEAKNNRVIGIENELASVYATRLWRIGHFFSSKGNVRYIWTRYKNRKRRKRHLSYIRRSKLFDANWYLSHYPDIAQASIDPASHYLEYGGFEFRDPGPAFSSRDYLADYPDVRDAGINPLLHFELFGCKEGRLYRPPR
jgi:hypothetical protein